MRIIMFAPCAEGLIKIEHQLACWNFLSYLDSALGSLVQQVQFTVSKTAGRRIGLQ